MELVADLHVHSRFSRATSSDADLEHLWIAAQRKGVQIVGTGDLTHPAWFAELEQKLRPAEGGLYELRPELRAGLEPEVPPSCRAPVRFLLTVEISNIYKQGGRVRKVHNLVCLPDLEAAAELCRRLSRIGNLQSDGRPILGLDSRDLLELAMAASPRAVLIPAHIWTPWFSALGSRSGFDSIEECYRDLAGEVFAVETGLSSDPPMNWRLSRLDRYALVSSSDAHSPGKLAREATLLACEPSYDSIFRALRERRGLAGTLEFFPEEGKYHLDGHRRCNVRLTPAQTRAYAGRCPTCGKPVTVGVLSRVEELADRVEGGRPEGAAPFLSLVGLGEVLGEVLGVGAESQSVQRALGSLLARLGPELTILRSVPVEELGRAGGPALAEAVGRMRRGELQIEGGYDGEFGRVHLLADEERADLAGQASLFGSEAPPRPLRRRTPASAAGPKAAPAAPELPLLRLAEPAGREHPLVGLSDEQRRAALHRGSPVVIVAGPGTGKTRTLTCRIAARVLEGHDPRRVLAVTFTQRAAGELRERLCELLGRERGEAVRVSTFHALGLCILLGWRAERGLPPLRVLGDAERLALIGELLPGATSRELQQASVALGLRADDEDPLAGRYRARLEELGAVDLDGLVAGAVRLLEAEPELLSLWRERCAMVCVDEYQDLNRAQYLLVRLLCPEGADLCVIGDPDQAIYGFRGADSGYFKRFLEDYPGAACYRLERSHRSAAVVLEAAQRLIAHDPARLPGRTFSELPGPPRIGLLRLPGAVAEAELVVAEIERLIGGVSLHALDSGRADGHAGELGFGDFGVLFRTRAQAELLLQAFDRSGIPCCCSATRDPGAPLAPVLALLDPAAPDHSLLDEVAALPPRAALLSLASRLCDGETLVAAERAIERVAPLLFDAAPGAACWGPRLLALLAGASEADALPVRREAVSLLTLHASKGLEFDTVFVLGCEEGLIPHLSSAGDLAEERRLLYVGMTRARRQLLLCWAARRGRDQRPSRFLEEIGAELMEPLRLPAARPRARQLSLI